MMMLISSADYFNVCEFSTIAAKGVVVCNKMHAMLCKWAGAARDKQSGHHKSRRMI
jgi:hypothetical protein